MGNLQVRFLEGWAPAMAPGYSNVTVLDYGRVARNGQQAPNELPVCVALLLSTFRFLISRREAAASLAYDTSRNFGCLVYLGVRDCRADGRARADKVSLHNFIFILNSEVFEIHEFLRILRWR